MPLVESPPALASDKKGAPLSTFGPLAFVAALIFALSSFRADELPVMAPPWAAYLPAVLLENLDKVAHFGVYALLGAAAFRGFSHALSRSAAGLSLLFCLAYGASDELHQAFVPGRTPDVLDWLADGTGAAAGIAIAALLLARLAPSRRRSLTR